MSAAAIDRSETKPPACYRCGGSGTYSWGGTVNGVPVHSGQCYACQGGGEYRPTQGKYYRRSKVTA